MKIKNGVYTGQELCEMCNEDLKSFQKNPSRLKRKLEQVCNIETKSRGRGARYIISNAPDTEIEFSNGGNRKYTDNIEYMILSLLNKYEVHGSTRVGFSKNLLYEHCGLVNSNFRYVKNNIKLLSVSREIPHQAIGECFNYTNIKLTQTLETTLKRMQREELITWDNGYNLAFHTSNGEKVKVATEKEIEKIRDIESKIINEIKCKNKHMVFVLGKWNEFKQKVTNELKKLYPELNFYYDAITFSYNNEIINERVEKAKHDSLSIKKLLNSDFSKGLDMTIEKRSANDKFFGIGEDIYENYRLSDTYIYEQKYIKNLIINLDEEKIINKILKDDSKDKKLYNDLKKEFEKRYGFLIMNC